MTAETREAAIRALDNSLGQIMADTGGVYLDGWPVEARRPRWELNHDAMLVDTYAGAISRLCEVART